MRNVMMNADRTTRTPWTIEGASEIDRRGRNLRGVSARCVYPNSGGAAPGRAGEPGLMGSRSAHGGLRQTTSGGAAQQPKYNPIPIWLAALSAINCLACRNGEDHAVSWHCISGRALYTNAGTGPEVIQPLGVSLESGQTLAVYWIPGETTYTMEVYAQN